MKEIEGRMNRQRRVKRAQSPRLKYSDDFRMKFLSKSVLVVEVKRVVGTHKVFHFLF